MTDRESFASIVDALQKTLTVMADRGRAGFDCSERSIRTLGRWGAAGPGGPESLDDIRRDLGDCPRCRLSQTRRNIVFGAGDGNARILFVGEGPGADEDRQGEPFVGAAGQLLTRIIEAMHLIRQQVYIANIIKCRPPGNRNPSADEIEACLPFLKRQIAAIRPDFICALGTVAAQTLLETREPISRLRGRFHAFDDRIRLMPTFHPAYLLRNPGKKREVWADIQQLMREMET